MAVKKVSQFLSFAVVILLHQRYAALRRERGDGVLIDHLLASVAIDHDCEIVKSLDRSANLEPVRQIYRCWNIFLPQLV
ncbi:hypothetical protein D1872_329610 [compost metagenome]